MPEGEEVVETPERHDRLKDESFGASPRTRRCFHLGLLLALALAAIGLAGEDPMYASAMATAVVCLALILRLVRSFPRTLDRIWTLGVLRVQGAPAQEPEPTAGAGIDEVPRTPRPDERHTVLKDYTRTLSDRLNWRWQWIAVLIVVSALSAGWRILYALEAENPAAFLHAPPFKDLAMDGPLGFGFCIVGFAAELFVVTVVGMLALRFVIIGWELTRLPHRFDLEPLFHHPDRCGGLKPLGSLSQLMALTLTVPGIVLAVWIVVAEQYASRYGDRYDEFLQSLLLVLIILAAITFFAPLWRVHQVMVHKASFARLGVAHLGRRVDELTKLLLSAGSLSAEKEKQLTSSLQFLRGLYKESQRLPVWPFDLGILARSLGPLVPLMSFVGQGTVVTALREILPKLGEFFAN